MRIIKFNLILISLFFIYTKNNEKYPSISPLLFESLNINKYDGNWKCYKYLKDEKITDDYSDNYAKEFSKYASFKIKNDSLIIDRRCKTKIYDYKYYIKKRKFEEESIFINRLKIKKDTLDFISNYNTAEFNCEKPFKIMCFFNNEFIIHDRGYFFFFSNNNILNNEIYFGIPSDNRAEWEINYKTNNVNIENVLNEFKDKFPYGAENLLKTIPKKSYIDKKNNILYECSKRTIKISKNDKMGTIIIEFKIGKNSVIVNYKMEYLENG